jgi:phosphatidylglycerol:prolipoprotein diacylglycerol transferase
MPPTTTDFLGTTIHKFEVPIPIPGFGTLPITGFGIAMLLSFLIAQYVATNELERRGQTKAADAMADVVLGAVLGGLLGAKIYYMILFHESFFSRGGFVFWGGLIGGILATAVVIRLKKLPFSRISDATSIGLAAAYAVGRSGCWTVGDDYGRPWDSPLAVKFPDGAPPSTVGNMMSQFGVTGIKGHNFTDVMGVYPTQLFEIVMGMLMFGVLWRLRDHKHAEGWLFGLYCVLAGIERIIVEFFRAKDDRFFGPFTLAQTIAMGFVVLGAIWMQMRRTPSTDAPGIYAAA